MIDNKDFIKIVNKLKIEENKNLYNLLEFCNIVEDEKGGIIFLKKMILNLIENNKMQIKNE